MFCSPSSLGSHEFSSVFILLHEEVQANEDEYNEDDQVVHVLTPRRVQHISHLAYCVTKKVRDGRKRIAHGAEHVILRVHLIVDVLA